VNDLLPRLVRVLETSFLALLAASHLYLCQVLQRRAIQLLVNQNGHLKFNTPLHWQAMKLPEDGCDVLASSASVLYIVVICPLGLTFCLLPLPGVRAAY